MIAINTEDIVVTYNHTKTTKDEANWISLEIEKLIANGYSFNDIAILYRAHFVSRPIEQSFIEKNIKYKIFNGVEFFKRKEIKDVLSYLRMIVYTDDLSFARIINVPKRNFGKKRMEIIKEYAENHNLSLYQSLKENLNNELIKKTDANKFVEMIDKFKMIYNDMKVSDIFSEILDESGYEEYLRTLSDDDRLNNVSELKNTIKEFEKNNQEDTSLEEYLNTISLYTDLDVEDKNDCVKMMTIHSAKGLEFPVVFVCGLNEGIFPSSKIKTYNELEEERRIAYVAFTRAQKKLFLSDAEGYNYDNSYRYPSRFIFNVGKENLNYLVELDDELCQDCFANIEERENSLINNYQRVFKVGDIIKHELLGIGKILFVDEAKMNYEIKFDNLDTNRNIGFCAPMELINMVNCNNSEHNEINENDDNNIKEEILTAGDKNKKSLISKIFQKLNK